MIDGTLGFIEARLNAYLREMFPSDTDWVTISAVTSSNGDVVRAVANRIVLTLINIDRDGVATRTTPRTRIDDTTSLRMNPTLQINLDMLVSAHFDDDYRGGLKLLSSVIGYFQAASLFTPQSAPDLPDDLEKLTVEWVDLSHREIHNLWTVLGGRYMPSALYRLRMLSFQQGWVTDDVPIITGVGIDT